MNDRNRSFDAARESWVETERAEEEEERDNVINGTLASVEDAEPETEVEPDGGIDVNARADEDAERASERFLHDMGETPSNV
jgi:hypothetical protein